MSSSASALSNDTDSRIRVDKPLRAYKLAEIRQSQHVTQKAVAAAMGVAQPRVSAIERGQINSAELGTLRSDVEALGGRLRLVADFGDETITVSN